MPMLSNISGAERKTKIQEWTVLGSDDGMAQKAVKFSEQIRAATGVDLAKVANRLGSAPPKRTSKK